MDIRKNEKKCDKFPPRSPTTNGPDPPMIDYLPKIMNSLDKIPNQFLQKCINTGNGPKIVQN